VQRFTSSLIGTNPEPMGPGAAGAFEPVGGDANGVMIRASPAP
jgi:hypothetical protein